MVDVGEIMNKRRARPAAEAVAKMATTNILLSPASSLSLNALCPDVRWDDAIRIALRLAVDFPDPDIDDPATQWAVISAVAESLVGS